MTLWDTNKAFLIAHRRTEEIEIELDSDTFEKIKAAAEIEGVSIEEFIELAAMSALGLSYVDLYLTKTQVEDR